MEVISLLKSKNRCLQRFLEISNSLLESADKGDFSSLDSFNTERDAVLRTVDLFDRKITETASRIHDREEKARLLPDLEKLLSERDDLIRSILLTDEKIVRLLDNEKKRVSDQLATNRKTQSSVAKFKSSWIAPSGEEIDQKL